MLFTLLDKLNISSMHTVYLKKPRSNESSNALDIHAVGKVVISRMRNILLK